MKKTYQTPELYINLMAKEDIMSASTNELAAYNGDLPGATGDVISIEW